MPNKPNDKKNTAKAGSTVNPRTTATSGRITATTGRATATSVGRTTPSGRFTTMSTGRTMPTTGHATTTPAGRTTVTAGRVTNASAGRAAAAYERTTTSSAGRSVTSAGRTTSVGNTTDGRSRYHIPGASDYRDKTSPDVQKEKVSTSKAKGSTKHTKKKNTVGALWGIAGCSLGIVFILVLVMLVQFAGNNANKNNTGSMVVVGDQVNNGATTSTIQVVQQKYLSINEESCTVYIGQHFKLTLDAYPIELAQTALWSSNREDILVVDQNGEVWVVGEGIAAITVTSGNYSAAIAVEAVADSMSETMLGFPLYVDNGSNDKPSAVPGTDVGYNNGTESNNQNGQQPTDAVPGQQATEATTAGQQATEAATAGQQPTEAATAGQQPTEAATEGQQPTEAATAGQQPTDNPPQEQDRPITPPPAETKPAIDIVEMISVLSDSGFSGYLANTCIYQKNNEYQGEIIVAPDSVHIYIKERSSEFDQAVKNTLAYLLPNTFNSVWNSYLAATSDRTINSDGKRVRFVMPAVGAHSQIIVYNQ